MTTILKDARTAKGFTTRDVSEKLKIDQALISKFENGLRAPTKQQILQLSELYEIEPEPLLVDLLKNKIVKIATSDPLGVKALKAAEHELSAESETPSAAPASYEKLMAEMETIKAMLSKK
ncbi:MAG TPA: helix-turn-helix transcriptional regulator [Flavobacterium sp.]|jgi:transcriptional regulator with XRE-family HTH domain